MRIAFISLMLLVPTSVLAQSTDHASLVERLRLCPDPTVAGLVHCALEPANPKFSPENADIWNPELYKSSPYKNWWNVPNLTFSPAIPATVPTSPPDVQRVAAPSFPIRRTSQGEKRSSRGSSMAPHVITKAPAMVVSPDFVDNRRGPPFGLHLPGRYTFQP